MRTTLVALFDSFDAAQHAADELRTLGVDGADVSITRNQEDSGYATYRGDSLTTATSRSHKHGIAGFFENLFGHDVDADDRGLYAEAVRRGSIVLTADVDEANADRAADLLNRLGSVDLTRRAAQYESTGYKGFDPTAPLYTTKQTRAELERFG